MSNVYSEVHENHRTPPSSSLTDLPIPEVSAMETQPTSCQLVGFLSVVRRRKVINSLFFEKIQCMIYNYPSIRVLDFSFSYVRGISRHSSFRYGDSCLIGSWRESPILRAIYWISRAGSRLLIQRPIA